MLKTKKLSALSLIVSIYLIACSKASDDRLAMQNNITCDTATVNYSSGVLPVISANCYICHNSGENTGGITLDSYANLKIQADNGNLAGAVTHAPGYTPMPYQQPQLSVCDITKIIKWINSGSPDN